MLPYDPKNDQLEQYRLEPATPQGAQFTPRPAEFSTRDLLYTLFRHKWKIALLFVMTTAVSVFYVTHVKDYYESVARLRIGDARKDLAVNLDPGNGSLLSDASGQNDSIRGEIGLIRSSSLASRVVDMVGVDTILGPAPARPAAQSTDAVATPRLQEQAIQVAKKLQSDLNLKGTKLRGHDLAAYVLEQSLDVRQDMGGSNILLLTYRARTPDAAQKVLQAIVKVYEQYHIEAHQSDLTPEFSDDQAKEYEHQLVDKENQLAALKKQLDITSLKAQMDLYQQQLATLDQNNNEASRMILSLRAKIRVYDDLLTQAQKAAKEGKSSAVTAVPGSLNPLTNMMRQRILQLEEKEAGMAQSLSDKNPELIQLRAQIADLKENLVQQQTGGPNAIVPPAAAAGADPAVQYVQVMLQTAKADLEGELASQGAIKQEITTARAKLNNLIEHQRQVSNLEREVSLLDQRYTQYKKTQQVAEFAQLLDKGGISNVKVIDEPTYSTASKKNIRKLLAILVFGSLFGLVAGVALAFALDWINPTLVRPEDVERHLGLPVMVSIPRTRHHRVLIERQPS